MKTPLNAEKLLYDAILKNSQFAKIRFYLSLFKQESADRDNVIQQINAIAKNYEFSLGCYYIDDLEVQPIIDGLAFCGHVKEVDIGDSSVERIFKVGLFCEPVVIIFSSDTLKFGLPKSYKKYKEILQLHNL